MPRYACRSSWPTTENGELMWRLYVAVRCSSSGGNPWISLHRNHVPAEDGAPDVTAIGTSEISMRNQYRAWSRYMTMTM